MKKSLFLSLTLLLVLGFSMQTYAGWWHDANRWLYFESDGSTRARDGWKWIDSDDNGVAECYYFLSDGTLFQPKAGEERTPDGYLVNRDGKWINDSKQVWEKNLATGEVSLHQPNADEIRDQSPTIQWIRGCYGPYYKDFRTEDRGFQTKEYLIHGLETQWGISDRDSGLWTVLALEFSASSSDDKAGKAWDYSRAMQLLWMFDEVDYLSPEEALELQLELAMEIQPQFTSWDDYYENYLAGYVSWIGEETRQTRRRRSMVEAIKSNSEFAYGYGWNIALKKDWE